MPLEQPCDGGGIGDDEPDVPAERKGEIAGQAAVERIDNQQLDRARIRSQRHDAMPPGEFARNDGRDFGGDRRRQFFRAGQAQMVRHRAQQSAALDPALLHDDARQRPAGGAAFVAQQRQRLRRHKAPRTQKRGDGLIVAFEHRGCEL